MQNIIEKVQEIRQLARQGMKDMILADDSKTEEIFLEIMEKSKSILDRLERKDFSKENTSKENVRTRTGRIPDDVKQKVNLVAYCFSEYEHTSLYPNRSQQEAFELAAQALEVKKNTLSNIRDSFDGHNNSHRRGWYQAELSSDLVKTKEICSRSDKNTILAKARQILGIL